MKIKTFFSLNFFQNLIFFFKNNSLRAIFLGKCQFELNPSSRIEFAKEGRAFIGKIIGPTGRSNDITQIKMKENSTLVLGSQVVIGSGCSIRLEKNSFVSIGQDTYLSSRSIVSASTSVKIGDSCKMSWNLAILDDDGHKYDQKRQSEPIEIGNNCWIACNVTFLKGSKIGNNVVVASGSIVTKVFPDNCVIGGVPAKIIRQN